MERDEVLDRIRKGEQYMQRTDITDEQRKNAEERYCNLVALLGTMPESEEEKPVDKPQDPVSTAPEEVQKHIDKIWRTLDPEGKRRIRA